MPQDGALGYLFESSVTLQARAGASLHRRRASPGEAGRGSQGHFLLPCACPGPNRRGMPNLVGQEGRVGKYRKNVLFSELSL